MNVGDRVRVTKLYYEHGDHDYFFVGAEGVLVEAFGGFVAPHGDAEEVFVLFDKDVRGSHDAWYVRKDQLELVA